MASKTPLKRAIEASGLKQAYIAEQIGVSQFTMSRIVHGDREPSKDERQSIAALLRRKVHELFPEVAA